MWLQRVRSPYVRMLAYTDPAIGQAGRSNRQGVFLFNNITILAYIQPSYIGCGGANRQGSGGGDTTAQALLAINVKHLVCITGFTHTLVRPYKQVLCVCILPITIWDHCG